MKRFAGLRPRTALLSLATIAVVDLVFWWRYPPIVIAGPMDETAHMLTALILLSVWRRPSARATVMAVLAGAVLIDVDHVPAQVFGWDILTRGTVRPYSHSLSTLVVLGGVWLLASKRWRPLVAGAAFGFLTHLLRDIGPVGVPLLWPLSTMRVTLPYAVYATVLTVAVGVIVWRGRFGRHVDAPSSRPSARRLEHAAPGTLTPRIPMTWMAPSPPTPVSVTVRRR